MNSSTSLAETASSIDVWLICVDSIISHTSLATLACCGDERSFASIVVATRKTMAMLKVQAAREGVRKIMLPRLWERGSGNSAFGRDLAEFPAEQRNPIQFG